MGTLKLFDDGAPDDDKKSKKKDKKNQKKVERVHNLPDRGVEVGDVGNVGSIPAGSTGEPKHTTQPKTQQKLVTNGTFQDEKQMSWWDRRVASGAPPIPHHEPRIIPYESLKKSHPEIYERYKRGPADNHAPTPACLAKEIDEAFRQQIADALRRNGDEDGARRILGSSSTPATKEEADSVEHDLPAQAVDVEDREGLERQPQEDFWRAAARQLWYAHARVAVQRATRAAESAREERAQRLLVADLDLKGNLFDPVTGEILSGPDART